MKDEIEQSITRTYRPSIWSRFIKALKTFSLLKEGDSLILLLSLQKENLLLAKLFQILRKHSDFSFEITYVCLKKDYDVLKNSLAIMNIEVKQILDLSEIDSSSNIFISNHTFDDVINKTLFNMLYKGKYATNTPKYKIEDKSYINPLIYIRDKDINNFFAKNNIDAINKVKTDKEIYIDNLIKELVKNNCFVEMNIFKSATNVNTQKVLGFIKDDKYIEFNENFKIQNL